MPKSLSAGLILEKNRLDPAKPWCQLFELILSGTVSRRIANHPEQVVYKGQQYDPFPVRHEDLTEEMHKGLQKIAFHGANVSGELQDLLEGNDGLRGRKVIMRLINLDNPEYGDVFQTFYVESTQTTDDTVTFVLGKPIPIFDLRFPGRIIDRDLFPAVRV